MAVVNNEYCGIMCVNKPEGFTSFDVIAKMRGILKTRRIGHGGTLDPIATGVLPVFVGSAAKACDMLPDHDKTYIAGFQLGVTTDTQDRTGTVEKKNEMPVTTQQLVDAAAGFIGEIRQIPPMFSAVSVNGRRLYELARRGKTVERPERKITVYSLSLISYDEENRCGQLELSCSKGTYVRTIISDIGNTLGCGGMLTSLVRTRACGYTLDDCVTLDRLEEIALTGGDFSPFLRPVESVFGYLPRLSLDKESMRLYRNGVRLDPKSVGADADARRYAVYGPDNAFIGTAVVKDGLLRVEKNFR